MAQTKAVRVGQRCIEQDQVGTGIVLDDAQGIGTEPGQLDMVAVLQQLFHDDQIVGGAVDNQYGRLDIVIHPAHPPVWQFEIIIPAGVFMFQVFYTSRGQRRPSLDRMLAPIKSIKQGKL